jgi:hypothetical protein
LRIDEPGDDADVAPALRRVVEDVVELRPAGDQVLEHGLARLAEVLRDAIQELRVADLVLDLGRQRQLPAERRRPHDPFPLGEHPHELRVGMHLDEPQDRRAVLIGHPAVRLDLAARGDVRLEMRISLVVREVLVPRALAALPRRKDWIERERVGHRDPSSILSESSTR